MEKTKDIRKINLTLNLRGFDGGPLIGSFYVTCGSLFLEHVQITEHTFEAIQIKDVEVDSNDTVNFAIHGQPFNEEFPISQPIPDYYYQPESISLNNDNNVVINIQQKPDEVTFNEGSSKTESEVWKEIFARKYKVASGTIAKIIADASMEFTFEDQTGSSNSSSESEAFTYTVKFPLRKLIVSQRGGESNQLFE